MANHILSYDLNGARPSHKEVDDLLAGLGATRGRVLETVWYVGYEGSAVQLYDAVNPLLSENDRLIVVEAQSAAWRNLLIRDDSLQQAWTANQ